MKDKIQTLRNQNDTSVKKICEHLDITTQAYYKKVKHDNFSLKDLEKLSVLFSVPLSYFTDNNSLSTAISKDNNGNLVQNSTHVNIDSCKQEIVSLKEQVRLQAEIIELLKKQNV